jgi:hypothetical protein
MEIFKSNLKNSTKIITNNRMKVLFILLLTLFSIIYFMFGIMSTGDTIKNSNFFLKNVFDDSSKMYTNKYAEDDDDTEFYPYDLYDFNRTIKTGYFNKRINQSLSIIRNDSSFNIFLIESNNETLWFTEKQLCAIESAAHNNVNARVYILALVANFNNTDLFERYKNLYHIRLNPKELFKETPLQSWWERGILYKSNIVKIHLSDAGRLAILWKYGGFYSDLDTIAVRNWSPLLRFSGTGYLWESRDSMGNGFLRFQAGHSFLYECMKEFNTSYRYDGMKLEFNFNFEKKKTKKVDFFFN